MNMIFDFVNNSPTIAWISFILALAGPATLLVNLFGCFRGNNLSYVSLRKRHSVYRSQHFVMILV
jgi:hypothetical protein